MKKNEYHDEILLMETNIDDMTGENFGFLLNFLMDSGALDVYYTSAYGKKNRPLYILSLMIPVDKEEYFAKIIFKYSSTAGIRIKKIDRIIMNRKIMQVNIDGFIINIKKLIYYDIVKYYPEWDNCVEIAKKINSTPQDVYNRAILLLKKGSEI